MLAFSARFLRLAAQLMLLPLAAACHALPVAGERPSVVRQPQPTASATLSVQLILKFKPGVLACDAQGVARLAGMTATRLQFLRPMSGAACVVRLQSHSETQLQQDQKKLEQHPAIEWIESDSVMQAM